ncbi:PA0069 family radical SAM protein [Rhodobacter calidifons]|uniref:PA0069 family radical SAM protein n=1 Tax=Rhodobacter calidifons TaxID=2715277 RepID=A0ABX0G8S6_9RHOB|nr:PA0069 family radical SAM protein [Rhodobacter calidifons]NHB77101.1 PA0069 family radical SAM protein [Rhodobacter calidifons]
MSRPDSLLPGQRLRARGADTNRAGRYEATDRVAFDDGWDLPEDERLVATEVRLERPRSALSFNRSPDLPFDRSVNPYRGCEHGCIYCYARPSHAYLNLSPGLDFETRLIARPGIAAVLEGELRRPSYKVAPIAIGTNTDPYQPVERDHGLMREVLAVLAAFRHPVWITTRGTTIERDIDLIAPMAAEGLASVSISVTTLDEGLARRMEPRAPAPRRRLQIIERLARAGIPVRIQISPLIPALTDHELEAVMQAGRDAGARAANTIPLRLPREVADLFRRWLETTFPDRAARVMGRVRELHGGRDYDPEFGTRMRGQGLWAELIHRRADLARRRLGLGEGLPALRCDLFTPPPRRGDQLTLF